jgi:hypothetical protein
MPPRAAGPPFLLTKARSNPNHRSPAPAVTILTAKFLTAGRTTCVGRGELRYGLQQRL